MADFPTDVITNILLRLPLKSLLEFRSTSKSWRSLIDSNHFKTLHLHKLNSNLNLILCHNSELYSVDFPTLGTVNLNQPLKSYENDITIIGSCNGLICIKNFVDDIAILNPYLRKHWVLPYLSTCGIDDFVYGVGFGFGFDSFTGDYKLVKISYIESNVNLFSCKTNAWKTLPNMPYALSWKFTTNGVFVDHALHWSVVNLNCNMTNTRLIRLIVAFDLRFEVFNEVPLPKLGEGFEIGVSQLGGCLSIVVNYQNQNTGIDIWVMKQYGSKDSWFKLFSWFTLVKPMGYYSHDDDMKVLLKEHPNKLFWYNLKSKQVSNFIFLGIPNLVDAMFWMESLVQPPFPSENYRKQQKQPRADIIQATEDA